MDVTGLNWDSIDYLRVAAPLRHEPVPHFGPAHKHGYDLVGFGDAGVWVARSNGDGTFRGPHLSVENFGTAQGWQTMQHPRFVADITGDRTGDLVCFGAAGVWTALSNGDGTFAVPRFVLANLGTGQGWQVNAHPRFVADITGDGKADLIGFGAAGVWTALSNGDGTFQDARFVVADLGVDHGWNTGAHVRLVADLTGDGKADLIGFGAAGVWTALSNGDGTFASPRFVLANFGVEQGWSVQQHLRFVVDVTGDGRADLVGFGAAGIWTALSNGDGSFQDPRFVVADYSVQQGWQVDRHPRLVADLTGDGKGDIVGFGDAAVYVAVSNGDGTFGAVNRVLDGLGPQQEWEVDKHPRVVADVTGDGRGDIVAFGDAGVVVALSHGDGTVGPLVFGCPDLGAASRTGAAAAAQLRSTLESLQQAVDALIAQARRLNALPQFAAQISELAARLPAAKQALDECLLAPLPDRVSGSAAADLLRMTYVNPEPPLSPTGDWTVTLVGTDTSFPNGAAAEWVNIVDVGEEWDGHPVGASGWVIGPEFSGADVPFTHPFGRDWEFYFAVDPDDAWLVAAANQTDTASLGTAQKLQLPVGPNGLLGVEMERGQLPDDFVLHAREGDRIAVLGRWIVDAGHYLHTNKDDSLPPLGYRTEIHPPLLMACAGLRTEGARTLTRTVLTTRAYLASEKFVVDTADINDDTAADDGLMVAHITNEVTKVVEFKSNELEAHPKVMSKPFSGRHELTITLDPPPRPPTNPVVAAQPRLAVSYHFTTRGSCTATLASDGSSVALTVVLDDAAYPLTGLPRRNERVYGEKALTEMNADVGPAYDSAEKEAIKMGALLTGIAGAIVGGGILGGVLAGLSALRIKGILDGGVTTDEYAGAEHTPIFDSGHPVRGATPQMLAAGQGITRDDTQPYPVLGWVELEWVFPSQTTLI